MLSDPPDGIRVDVALRRGKFALAVAFAAPVAGVVAIFGPSGSGKTTLLASLAGLLPGGGVTVQGVCLDLLPAERRRVGLVFQDARLFPHLTVRQNLLYGARRAGAGCREHGRFEELCALLDLSALLDRAPRTLSGGERARVAIGRALLARPVLLLLDEPLAAIDPGRRDEILPYLARLREEAGLPILYVTHNLEEVRRLADWLVVLQAGRAVASGAVGEMLARSELGFSQAEDAAGVLRARVVGHEPRQGLTRLEAGGMAVVVPLLATPVGRAARLIVPAREVIVALLRPEGISVSNILPAVVVGVREDAARPAVVVLLSVAGGVLPARLTRDAAQRLELRPGLGVFAAIKAMSVEVW